MLKLLSILLMAVLFCGQAMLYAETIYKKDGTTIQGKIASKEEGSIWYELATGGDIVEEVSIDLADISKIINDDGTISQYSPTYVAPSVQKK